MARNATVQESIIAHFDELTLVQQLVLLVIVKVRYNKRMRGKRGIAIIALACLVVAAVIVAAASQSWQFALAIGALLGVIVYEVYKTLRR